VAFGFGDRPQILSNQIDRSRNVFGVSWGDAAQFLSAVARAEGGRLALAQAFARAVLANNELTALALAVIDGGEGAVTKAIELAEGALAQLGPKRHARLRT
jgi:hypothetical protein